MAAFVMEDNESFIKGTQIKQEAVHLPRGAQWWVVVGEKPCYYGGPAALLWSRAFSLRSALYGERGQRVSG